MVEDAVLDFAWYSGVPPQAAIPVNYTQYFK
jgi:hypothetical protein